MVWCCHLVIHLIMCIRSEEVSIFHLLTMTLTFELDLDSVRANISSTSDILVKVHQKFSCIVHTRWTHTHSGVWSSEILVCWQLHWERPMLPGVWHSTRSSGLECCLDLHSSVLCFRGISRIHCTRCCSRRWDQRITWVHSSRATTALGYVARLCFYAS